MVGRGGPTRAGYSTSLCIWKDQRPEHAPAADSAAWTLVQAPPIVNVVVVGGVVVVAAAVLVVVVVVVVVVFVVVVVVVVVAS